MCIYHVNTIMFSKLQINSYLLTLQSRTPRMTLHSYVPEWHMALLINRLSRPLNHLTCYNVQNNFNNNNVYISKSTTALKTR